MTAIHNKIAFYTILDNKFVNNFLFSLWSLKKFNNVDNIDILVFSKEEITDKNKKIIHKIMPTVKFIVSKRNLLQHSWPFDYDLKLEVYFLKEYDMVMYFDADVLFLNGFTDILQYKCKFGAVSYGDYFSATIMLFNKDERCEKSLNNFIKTFNSNKNMFIHDQAVFNKIYKDYFSIPYDYNQIFTNYNFYTAKCLQFPGAVKGLDKKMENLLLLKNTTPLSIRLKSYLEFKKIKNQFFNEVHNV